MEDVKNNERQKELVGKIKKKVGVLSIISASVIILLAVFWFAVGHVKVDVSDDLTVKSVAHSYIVDFEDVESVKILSHFTVGKSGTFKSLMTNKIVQGSFSSDSMGDYRVDAYKRVSRYVVVEKKNGEKFVFNAKDEESTERLFSEINQKVSQAKGL